MHSVRPVRGEKKSEKRRVYAMLADSVWSIEENAHFGRGERPPSPRFPAPALDQGATGIHPMRDC